MTINYNYINFESIHSNISEKIYFIDEINNILLNNILPKLDSNNYNNNQLEFKKYRNMLKDRLENYNEDKDFYINKSIVYIVPYYSLVNIKHNKLKKINYNNNYNNIDKNIIDTKLKDSILELKNIFIDTNYTTKFEFYKSNNSNITITNNSINKKSKKIYENYKIFISSNDIYGKFDDYIFHINKFIKEINNDIISDFLLIEINSNIKNINKNINKYYKTNIQDDIKEVNYDICNCGNRMIIQSNTSEFICTNCGYINTLIGTVFENTQFYNQEGSRFRHASYEPSRHCKFWVDRIQAKENTNIPENLITKIEECIKRDKIKIKRNISIEQFRKYLKDTNLSKYNDHLPLIRKNITGITPPQLNHSELQLLYNYFDKAVKTYNLVKKNSKNNNIYYPFLIWKILEIIINERERLKKMLSCIHLQGSTTLIENDRIWKLICNKHEEFKYRPTERII